MKISIVTDEISADLETAVELGTMWGIQHFELRTYNTERVPLFTDFQKQRVRELTDDFSIDFVAISPGIFKCPFPTGQREHFSLQAFDRALYSKWKDMRDVVKYHLEELLPRSIEYARELGVSHIVIFGFDRAGAPPGMPPDEVLEAFHRAATIAEQSGMTLSVEVEADFWVDTGARSAQIIEAVDHPALGINWDPGNAYVAGDLPYPDGYEAVKTMIKHVHFKDVKRLADGSFQYAVNGDIDWEGQIRALVADQYDGFISVETHMQPKINSAKAVLERLRQLTNR